MKEVHEVKRVQGLGIRVQSLIYNLSSLIVKKLHIGLILLFPLLLQAQGTIIFSKPGGRYDHTFFLKLQCDHPSYHIHYTINGGTPTASSPRYEASVLLNASLQSSSCIYKIKLGPDTVCSIPEEITKAIVIRAAAFDDAGVRVSPVVTQTYFISDLDCGLPNLPVVSICADSAALFDYTTGILVPGIHFDDADPRWTGNYYMSGREWERLCNVEYYDTGNNGFNQEAGLRTHGGNGRRYDQKGLKIYAREEYGKKRFTHKIFDDCEVTRFKHLVLKPFRCAWTNAGIQNHLSYLIARNLDIDVLASRPVVMFLNGEYWGIYFIQEKADERYLENHYDIDSEEFNVIGNWFGLLDAGDVTGFLDFMDFVESADLSDSTQYHQLEEKMDINNFIDYQLLEIFIANEDWPANNMRCWQVLDRKWRWIFYDGDGCFRKLYGHLFGNATSESTQFWPTNAQSTLLFRGLLQNKTFRKQFVNRFNDLSNTYFSYRYTGNYLRDIHDQIQDEIPRQADRFGLPTSAGSWEYGIRDVDNFLQQRLQVMTDSLRVFFNLPEDSPHINTEVTIFPNPSSGHFNLLFQSEEFGLEKVIIKDMSGRTCYVNTFFYDEGENIIPVRCNLRSGTYIVTVGKVSKKLVIAR